MYRLDGRPIRPLGSNNEGKITAICSFFTASGLYCINSLTPINRKVNDWKKSESCILTSTPPPLRNRKRFRRNNRPKIKKRKRKKKPIPESFILVLCVSLLDVPGSDCCSPYLERRSVTIISDPESIGLSITADRVRQSLSIVVRLGVALFNHRHHHHHPFLFDCFFLFIYFLFFS